MTLDFEGASFATKPMACCLEKLRRLRREKVRNRLVSVHEIAERRQRYHYDQLAKVLAPQRPVSKSPPQRPKERTQRASRAKAPVPVVDSKATERQRYLDYLKSSRREARCTEMRAARQVAPRFEASGRDYVVVVK